MLCLFVTFFFFKQKTAYEMRISDWRSDVCSSDLVTAAIAVRNPSRRITACRYCNSARTTLALVPPNPKEFDSARRTGRSFAAWGVRSMSAQLGEGLSRLRVGGTTLSRIARIEKIASTAPAAPSRWPIADLVRSEEHTSELQSLLRISYAVLCLKKNNK